MAVLSLPQFDRLFPFFICFDEALHIVSMGRSLKKLLPPAETTGPLFARFELLRPALKDLRFATLMQRAGNLVVLALRSGSLKLKGEVLPLGEGQGQGQGDGQGDGQGQGGLFVGTPWVKDWAELQSTGIVLKDLAVHDPTADLLIALKSMQTSVEDATRITEQLRQEAAQRESLVQELEAQVRLIEQQRQALHALSAPILRLWEGMLAVPLIGHVDEDRAAHLSERLLQAVSEQRARFVILDVTGVEALSNETARHLLQLLAAISLIGATGLISGIRAALAKTMVPLDLQLSHVQTFATLKDALTHCLPKLTQTGWKGLA